MVFMTKIDVDGYIIHRSQAQRIRKSVNCLKSLQKVRVFNVNRYENGDIKVLLLWML